MYQIRKPHVGTVYIIVGSVGNKAGRGTVSEQGFGLHLLCPDILGLHKLCRRCGWGHCHRQGCSLCGSLPCALVRRGRARCRLGPSPRSLERTLHLGGNIGTGYKTETLCLANCRLEGRRVATYLIDQTRHFSSVLTV